MTATLWLIPLPLGANSIATDVLPVSTLQQIEPLRHFVVETAKVARAFLRPVLTGQLSERNWYELNSRTIDTDINNMLAPLLSGEDVGLVSDAGCPGVADPGARLVDKVHKAIAEGARIKIRPLIGPSSLLLALMASGMNGQQFAFVGYLPAAPEARRLALTNLQARSAKSGETILMIETPYRSKAFFETAVTTLAPSTRLMTASQLSLPSEMIISRSIAQWRKLGLTAAIALQPDEPTVFAIAAER